MVRRSCRTLGPSAHLSIPQEDEDEALDQCPTRVGKQTIIDEIFRPLNRVLVERSTIPTRLIDGGDVVVLQATGRNLTSDGRRYDNDYAFVIHFKEGKIARYEEYCDTDLIARVLPDRAEAKSMSKPR